MQERPPGAAEWAAQAASPPQIQAQGPSVTAEDWQQTSGCNGSNGGGSAGRGSLATADDRAQNADGVSGGDAGAAAEVSAPMAVGEAAQDGPPASGDSAWRSFFAATDAALGLLRPQREVRAAAGAGGATAATTANIDTDTIAANTNTDTTAANKGWNSDTANAFADAGTADDITKDAVADTAAGPTGTATGPTKSAAENAASGTAANDSGKHDDNADGGGGSQGEPTAAEEAEASGGEVEAKAAHGPPRPLKPATRRLVDQLQIDKIKELGSNQLDLEMQRQALELDAQQLLLQEEIKRRERQVSRSDAVRDDVRLSMLPPKQVLSELVGAASEPPQKEQQHRGKSRVSLDAFVAARRTVLATPAGSGAAAEVRDAAAEAATQSARGRSGSQAAELLSLLRTRWDSDEEPGGEERGRDTAGPTGDRSSGGAADGGTMATRGSALPAVAPSVRLDDLVSALRLDLPSQALALQGLKMQRAISSSRLCWARRLAWEPAGDEDDDSDEEHQHEGGEGAGPAAGAGAGAGEIDRIRRQLERRRRRRTLLLDSRERELRQLALEIMDRVLDDVMIRLASRPSQDQVAAEVAAWRAAQPGALAGVARHLAEGLTHEVVDELIAEAYDEICHLKKVADSFAFDMLVEAVAFSQRKYTFGPGQDGVRARLRDAAAEQDANLARSLAAKRAATLARSLTRMATLRAAGGEAAGGRGGGAGVGGGGGSAGPMGSDADEADAADYANLYDTSHMLQGAMSRGIKLGDALSEDLDEDAIYLLHRNFEDTRLTGDEKQLYLQGLKAMLQEMRMRRGDAPYGHTQQLSVYWPPYVRVTRAQRLAAQRVRPPLAAGPSVWRHLLRETASRVPAAPWPGPDCAVAAAVERAFWGRVALRPTYLTAKNAPMVQVFRELGPITALSASPNGALLAVGTAPGAMLVFNMRGRPVAPWFQVIGDGQTYKRPWFRRQQPRNPALVALAWSADSHQLTTLDATSTLRMWWMRPEPGSTVKEEPGRQPVAPELILSIGPLSVAISGKAPVMEPLMEEQRLMGLDAGGAGASAAQAAQAAALARRWALSFHPEFNIAGVQPTVMVPQVTGDIVRLTTQMGSRVLPTPLPRTRAPARGDAALKIRLNQQTVDFLMPPQIRAPEVQSQALLRGHDAHIVFVGALADCASLLSVDANGEVHLWPAFEGDRTGYGWFRPRRTWRLPRALRSYQARGPLNPVWPRVQVPALRDIVYNPPYSTTAVAAGPSVSGGGAAPAATKGKGGDGSGGRGGGSGGGGGGLGFLRGLFRRRDPAPSSGGASGPVAAAASGGAGLPGPSQSVVAPPAVTYADMLADAGMLDDELEAARLEELPLGDFLLESRQLWMVRFLTDRNGRLLREAIHRPVGPNPWEQGGGGGGRPLVISTYTMDGELVRRAKQYVVHTTLPYRVVAAELTPSRRDLVVWCHVPPQAGDVDSFGYFSVQVLNVEDGFKPNTPRIDLYDHSRGASPPAFAASPRVPGLGSEYLVVGLAHGLLGFFSISTGAIVRVVQLPGVPTPSPYFACLSLFTVSPAFDGPNAGQSFVAVTPAASSATFVYQLDDSGGVDFNVRTTTAYGPLPGVAPPPPPEPILPSSQEPPPGDPGGLFTVAAVERGPKATMAVGKFRDAAAAAALATALRPPPVGRARQVGFIVETAATAAAAPSPRAPMAESVEAAEAGCGEALPPLTAVHP